MKHNNIIYNNIKIHLNINIAKPNLDGIYSTEWLNPNNFKFKENLERNVLPDDIIKYLTKLEQYTILQFFIGFHAINYQYWTPTTPSGFKPYIHEGRSGFYACLQSYFKFFKNTETTRKISSPTQIDFLTYFGAIPNSKERFLLLLDAWNPENMDNIYQIINEDIKEKCISIDTAYKISKIIPSCFDDTYLRKAIYLLWDYVYISQKLSLNEVKIKSKSNITSNTISSIKIDLPIIADHQTAKVLAMNNMIIYSDELKNKITQSICIEKNSPEELAIRACIIFVGEHIVKRLNINSLQLYQLMWQMRAEKNEPFFLCVNNNY